MQRGTLRRTLAATISAGLLAAVMTACGGGASGGGDGDGKFTIYMSVDKSGPTKSYSEAEIGGMNAAIDKLNDDGGIRGDKITLETVDDANDPTKAVNLLQKRLSKGDPPDLVFPGGSSAVTMSLLPVLTRNKIASMSTTSASTINDPKKFPYHFGVVFDTAAYIPPMVDAANQNGYKKIAMLHASDTSGQAAAANYKRELEKAGFDFVDASYEASALDMTPQLNKLKAQNPDALIVSGYGTAALYAFKSRAKLGWNLPTYGDQLASTFPLASSMKPDDLKNVKVVVGDSSLAKSGDFPALDDMVKEIKAGDDAGSLQKVGVSVYIVGYDIPMLFDYAADQAKSTKTEKVTDALEDLKQPSGTPPWLQGGKSGDVVAYDYDAENHFPTASKDALHYVAPGVNNADGFYVPGK